MNGSKDIMKENCRTCLSYFNEGNEKCSLLNCLAITSDSDRFELMKSVMTTCSLTLLQNKEDQEIKETFICMSCAVEIDQMLNFLQKCIHSESILKQAAKENIKRSPVWIDNTENELSLDPLVEIKVEDSSSGLENTFVEVDEQSVKKEDLKQKCHKTYPSSLLTLHRYKSHTCTICHETFQTLPLIKKHMVAKHDTVYHPYFCWQCSEVFTSRHFLTAHERRIHNAKKYSCGVCKRAFSTISSLKYHENIHLGQNSYSCTLCFKSFSSATMLRDHKKTAHSEIKPFVCHCGRSFNRKKKLEVHIEAVHEKKDKSRKYSCPECNKKFHHPYSLKNHINAHMGIKPFLCNVCGAAFTSLSNLTSHVGRIHSEDKQPTVKNFLCHTCGDSFARASHLQRHTLRKHVPNAEKKHECPICKKKFLEKSDVTGHLKLHDDVKPFVCDRCSNCFRTSWTLQSHIKRVHLGLRPFECPTCSVKFKAKSHLEKHIRTHTGEKPFPCPYCPYTCAEKSNLKKHINVHLKAT